MRRSYFYYKFEFLPKRHDAFLKKFMPFGLKLVFIVIYDLRVIGPRPLRCPKAGGCVPAHCSAAFRPRQFSCLPLPATGGGRHENPTSHARRAHNREAIVQIFPVSEELGNRKCDFRVLWLREKDLNLRPSGYEPDELPTAPSRDI